MLKEGIKNELNKEIEFIINEKYIAAIEELRAYARKETKELKSPIMRFLQIEEWTSQRIKIASISKVKSSHSDLFT